MTDHIVLSQEAANANPRSTRDVFQESKADDTTTLTKHQSQRPKTEGRGTSEKRGYPIMLQRWLDQSIKDEPFHGIPRERHMQGQEAGLQSRETASANAGSSCGYRFNQDD